MGGVQSSQSNLKGVFNKELNKVENIVNSIINNNDTFKDSSYNFMNSKVCDNYTMVLENKLSKHLKIHLHELSENIYFIPKSNNEVKIKNNVIKKKDICSLISQHYKKTLKLLSLVREVYDFENGGDFSIAGIIYRNLNHNNGMYEISYCGLNQEPLTNGSKVDFKQLKGLDMFVNDFLTESEAKVFISHLRELFGNYSKKRIVRSICEDTIVDASTYQKIYDNIDIKCQKGGGGANNNPNVTRKYNNLLFNIHKNKPIISYELCFDKQKIQVPYDRKIRSLFRKFKDDYTTNIDHLMESVNKLIFYDQHYAKYRLRDLTHDELKAIEIQIKKCIIILFIQSLVNYFKILNYVKK